ncbi:MAG: S1/P1 nuclease [Acidobacteria bacterium]|nr:S1/P1 nuclease [Acidobacteriota bacterium]
MNKLSRILVVSLVIFMFSLPALSWDDVGHKLSAYIAWDQMTPAARKTAIDILLNAPEDSHLSVLFDAFNSRSKAVKERELFMFASIWGDVIRNRQFENRYKKYNQPTWHYSDIFWKQENGKGIELKDFAGEGGSAITKLYDFEKVLRDPEAPKSEKAVALAWFLHVGGDIHNPLHNASRVTDTEPKGDQGGNLITLREATKDGGFRVNLHGYWDSIIDNYIPRKNDACDVDYIAPIARKTEKRFPAAKMRGSLELGDYKRWNREGFNLLNDFVYTPDVERNRMPSEKYRKRTFYTADKQIALAGYRLGETLNSIFDPQSK